MNIFDEREQHYRQEAREHVEFLVAHLQVQARGLEEILELNYIDRSIINSLLGRLKYISQNVDEKIFGCQEELIKLRLTMFYQAELAKEQRNEK